MPEIDPKGRASDARTADDELRREERALEARAAEMEAATGVRPRVRIAVGATAANLLEAAGEGVPEKTLVAVGSRGLGSLGRARLGSVSTNVLRAARGPVLVHPMPHQTDEGAA